MFMAKVKIQAYLVLALLLCGCASTGTHQAAARLYFLNETALQERQFAPAPLPGSAADKADFAALHDWQDKRTVEQCARAHAESHATFEEFFGDSNPFEKPLPKEVSVFFNKVLIDTDEAVSVLKKRNNRPRPFWRDSTLNPCLGRIGGLAYPSGHATLSRMDALILAYLVPAQKDLFIAKADEAANYRIIGGVHHPSDIAAGKQLAESLFPEFMANPQFRAELDGLRKYLAAPAL